MEDKAKDKEILNGDGPASPARRSTGCDDAEKKSPRPNNPETERSPGISAIFGSHSIHFDVNSLCTPNLPKDIRVREHLFIVFFEQTQHIHNLSFIHEPTFFNSLHRGDAESVYGEPLLNVMGALAARQIFFDENAPTVCEDAVEKGRIPGEAWIEKAKEDVVARMRLPILQDLMAMTLLCEYELRRDDHTEAFRLVAMLNGGIRLLNLDSYRTPLPHDATTQQIVLRECQNRLVWAAYFLDLFVSNCEERRMCWKREPCIPLPCRNRFFAKGTRPTPLYLSDVEHDGMLSMLHEQTIQCLNILILRLRSNVMAYLDQEDLGPDAWELGSPFRNLVKLLERFEKHLPEKYQLDENKTLELLYDGLLGPVFSLHMYIHVTMSDLAKFILPGFNYPLKAGIKDLSDDVRWNLRLMCKIQANKITDLFCKSLEHGSAIECVIFDDVFCIRAIVESTKIHIVHSATVAQEPKDLLEAAVNIRSGLCLLASLHRQRVDVRKLLIRELLLLRRLFGLHRIVDDDQKLYVDASSSTTTLCGDVDLDPSLSTSPADYHDTKIDAQESTDPARATDEGIGEENPTNDYIFV